MESNTEVKTPKLNKTNISSAFFGNEGGSASSIKNIHGTVSKLAGHVRKAVIRVGVLEKNVSNIEEKLKKEPDDKETKKESKNNFNSTLLETNKILVDIQKQLEQHFSNLAKEEKEKQQTLKKEKSKKRFGMEEGALESAKRIGSALVKTTSKILSPVKGFFDKILAFLGFLAAGFLTNAVFGWLSKEENQKKLQKFFNILTQNWKLFAKILGTAFLGVLAVKMLGFASAIAGIIGFLAQPAVLAGLALAAGLVYGMTGKNQEQVTESVLQDAYGGNKEKMISDLKKQKEGLNFFDRYIRGVGAEIDEQIQFIETGKQAQYGRKGYDTEFGKSLADKTGLTPFLSRGSFKDKFGFDAPSIDYSKFNLGPEDIFKNIEPRAMGGPVMAGRTYLVGEKGPELFSPNIDGSIVNNMRTEKIYNMISKNPKRNRKVNIQTMDLPPITVPMGEGSSTSSPSPAPSVPTISSRNILDSMRNETPGIYGIYV